MLISVKCSPKNTSWCCIMANRFMQNKCAILRFALHRLYPVDSINAVCLHSLLATKKPLHKLQRLQLFLVQ